MCNSSVLFLFIPGSLPNKEKLIEKLSRLGQLFRFENRYFSFSFLITFAGFPAAASQSSPLRIHRAPAVISTVF
jgi:hypothetical protein